MKPTPVLDMHRTGDLGGNKVTMKIDENSLAHVMSLLTDLYSDPELAVIREYSTNARDSHIMAGNADRPIEVTLPNNMSPYFKVKDFGLGMDVDDIEETYSKYGASTKRGSNDANGMLGLGCKSALTYTSQFTITAVKNGEKSIVVVRRVEDGTGVMEIVHTAPSDEPNSVEISVPVKQGNRFHQKAPEFFRFWPEGTVLVNGEKPARIKGKWITSSLLTTKDVAQDTIVMGNVAYPVPNGLYGGYRGYNSFKVVAFVEIGEVNFTPSRESLSMTPLTKATIAQVTSDFAAALHSTVRAEIEAAPTAEDALNTHLEWAGILAGSMPKDTTYKGQYLQFEFKVDYRMWSGNRGRWGVSDLTEIDHATLRHATIITGYDASTEKNQKGLTPTMKKKMLAVREANGWGVTSNYSERAFVLIKGTTLPGAPWVNPKRVLKWEDVIAHKLPRAAKGTGAVKDEPKYDVYFQGKEEEVVSSKIDKKTTIYYISPRNRVHHTVLKSLTTELGGATIVVLGENRWEKFLRDFPTAQRLTPAVEALRDKVTNALTLHDKQNLTMDYYEKQFLSQVDATLVDDPSIKAHIAVAKGLATTPTITEYERVKKIVTSYGVRFPHLNGTANDILADYPLINGGHVGNIKHAILYMNAVYAAKKNGAI